MGAEHFILSKTTKEYCWLPKRFYPYSDDESEYDNDKEFLDEWQEINRCGYISLHKFLHSHQYEDLLYGSAQCFWDIAEKYLDYNSTNDFELFKSNWKEITYND